VCTISAALAIRDAKNVIWAQELFPIGIYRRKYLLGREIDFRGSESRGGISPGRHCHSTLSLTVMYCHSALEIYTVILLPLSSLSVKRTVSPRARGQHRVARVVALCQDQHGAHDPGVRAGLALLRENGLRLAQEMQVGPCIPAGVHLERAGLAQRLRQLGVFLDLHGALHGAITRMHTSGWYAGAAASGLGRALTPWRTQCGRTGGRSQREAPLAVNREVTRTPPSLYVHDRESLDTQGAVQVAAPTAAHAPSKTMAWAGSPPTRSAAADSRYRSGCRVRIAQGGLRSRAGLYRRLG
jgi:hypothetical protein